MLPLKDKELGQSLRHKSRFFLDSDKTSVAMSDGFQAKMVARTRGLL